MPGTRVAFIDTLEREGMAKGMRWHNPERNKVSLFCRACPSRMRVSKFTRTEARCWYREGNSRRDSAQREENGKNGV